MSQSKGEPSAGRPEILAAAEISLPARFRQMVAAHPDQVAIIGTKWQPTYAELEAATNQLAHAILARGGSPGGRVALLLRHDAPLIAAAVAVLKAGRVVVVLNSRDPALRLKQIVADADADCLITDATNEPLAREINEKDQGLLVFEQSLPGPVAASVAPPEVEILPASLAWLIYTSGSTGRPKGVGQTHRNIVHNVWRFSQGLQLTATDRLILLGSPSGGQGVSTLWCALLNGATLVPFSLTEQGPAALKNCLLANRVTVYISSPSIFHHFVKTLADTDSFPDIRLVRFGSERATAHHLSGFKKHFSPACRLFNSLSSSETGNIAQQPFQWNDQPVANQLPVGREAPGMQVTLRDEQGAEVPPGLPGEIFVHSHYLSPGYWRNDLLTAEHFLPPAASGGPRIFRSGDLGQRSADGALIFLGRKDARIKIHGYRVELSEIRDALEQLPAIESTFLLPRSLPNGDNQILAYVIPRPGHEAHADPLRRALRQTLPGYMVPAHFIFLDQFPLTSHGKVDHAALPPPAENKKILPRHERPQDVVETRLARIWESVLKVAPIGRFDDFFDLGGTSLQSVEVLLHIREALGASLPPSVLTEHSTLEKLAAVLAGHVVIQSSSPLIRLREAATGRPLFLIHSGQGDVTSFGPLVRRLAGRPVYGLQSIGMQGEAWPLLSVPAMARRYVQEIVATDPAGPYFIGGTCMGGMIALEAAQMLREQGRPVALLALLDVPHPVKNWQHARLKEKVFAVFRDPVRDAFRLLRWRCLRALGLGHSARRLPAYRRFIAHMNSRANRRYSPKMYAGSAVLFITADTQFPGEDRRLALRRHLPHAPVIPIPGQRAGLFIPPNVDELARQLQQTLAAADNG